MKKRICITTVLLLLLGSLCVCAGAVEDGADEAVRLPVLMYHSILKDASRQGKYVVSPAILEEDFKYLQEHGYASVTLEELVAYTENKGELPEKPVLITFDDGYLNNALYAVPLLEKYDMHAIISVVGDFANRYSNAPDPNPNYAYLTWEDIGAAVRSGRVEIGNHTFAMHCQDSRCGSMINSSEPAEAYGRVLTDDLMKLQAYLAERSGCEPTSYAYPFGAVCEESKQLVKDMGFKASFTCYERVNTVTRDPESLFLLGRFNRPSGISTQEFMQKIQ